MQEKTEEFNDIHSIWKKLPALNKSDLQHNNNKFYILQLLESDTGAGMVFFTRWGRVGTTGQQSVVPTSFDRGVSLFNSKYREKTRGGYTEIIIDYSDDKEKSSSKKKPKKELTSSQKKKKSKEKQWKKEAPQWIWTDK